MFGHVDINDHGNLAGLGDDDHSQYLLIDGTRAMTGGLTLYNGADALNSGAYPLQLQSGELTPTNDAFVFDTSVAHTTGKLFDWNNNGASILSLDGSGFITQTSSGTGNPYVINQTGAFFGATSVLDINAGSGFLGNLIGLDMALTDDGAAALIRGVNITGAATSSLSTVSTHATIFTGIDQTNNSVPGATFNDAIANVANFGAAPAVGILYRGEMTGANAKGLFLQFTTKDGTAFDVDSKGNVNSLGTFISPRFGGGILENFVKDSNDATTARWTTTGTPTLTAAFGTGPDESPNSTTRIQGNTVLRNDSGIAVEANGTYTISLWVKQSVASTLNLAVETTNGDVATFTRSIPTGTLGAWVKEVLTATFTGASGNVRWRITSSVGTADFEIFGMSLTKEDFPIAYTPTGNFTVQDYFGLVANGDMLVSGDASRASRLKVIASPSQSTTNMLELADPTGTLQLAIAPNGRDFVLDTTTGTKLGTATAEKLGFWNATPVVQPVNTTDLDTLLSTVGLMASGAADAPFALTLAPRTGTAAAGTAPIKFTDGPLMTTPEVGAVEYEEGHLFLTTTGAARHAVSVSNGVVTSNTTVVNTVTETTIYTHVFPADSIHADEVIRATLIASYSNASASDDFIIRFKMNGTTIRTISRVGGNKTDAGIEVIGALTTRTVGASGTYVSYLKMVDDTQVYTVSSASTSSLDTTASVTFTITVQWANAKAGNTFTASQGFVEFLH